jgi:hypothetical protein
MTKPLPSATGALKALTALTALMLTLLLGLPLPQARAQEGPDVAACQADARKLCSGQRPGAGRVAACLQQHEAELSAACKSQLPKLLECSEQIKQACGEGRPRALRSCMQQNRDKLGACAGLVPPR